MDVQSTEKVNSFIDQLVAIRFESAFWYGIIVVLALIVCFEGYQLYRLALLLAGFAIGYTQMHKVVETVFVTFTPEQKLMAQGIAGIVCAIISTTLIKIGVFLVTFFFVKTTLAGPIATKLLSGVKDQVPLSPYVIPLLSAFVGLVIALLLARAAQNALRPAIVILTAAIGAFAVINTFVEIIPVFPYDLSFLPERTSIIWTVVKLFLMAAGVGIQGIKED